MKNVDYKSLRLLDLIIKEQGFEKASAKLFITQSAVSQRVKQLENQVGSLLLTRTVPPKPTELGQKLLGLLYHVDLIEHDAFDNESGNHVVTIPISINADSLATWFYPLSSRSWMTAPFVWILRWMMRAGHSTICSKGKRSGQSVCSRCLLSAEPVIIWGRWIIFLSRARPLRKNISAKGDQKTLLRAPVVSFNHSSDMHHIFYRSISV